MKILIYPALAEAALADLAAVAGDARLVNAQSEDEARRAIVDSDGMIGTITPDLLDQAQHLRWLQTPVAGLEHYLFPALIAADGLTLTNMAGIYSDHIADQALSYLLMFARGMHIYLRRQLQHRWQTGVPVVHLAGQTLAILGLGGIGSEVAKRGRALGMRVLAIEPRPRPDSPFVDEVWKPDRLNELLAAADFLVLCAPHTPETVRLIRAEQLQRMKPTAYLINISRGVVVDLADLTTALQTGVIAGAGLDVYEVEPLPADHPLWDLENAILTPHVAAADPQGAARRLGVYRENLRRFVQGEPLMNVVDKRLWY